MKLTDDFLPLRAHGTTADVTAEVVYRPRPNAGHRLKENKLALFGLFIIICMLLLAIVGPW